jgi:hypothetical protein
LFFSSLMAAIFAPISACSLFSPLPTIMTSFWFGSVWSLIRRATKACFQKKDLIKRGR